MSISVFAYKPLHYDSGITFIMYAQDQKIESQTNLNGLNKRAECTKVTYVCMVTVSCQIITLHGNSTCNKYNTYNKYI